MTEPAKKRADQLLAQLDLAEKLALLGGSDYWHTAAVERLGIASLQLSDGPSGVRGDTWVGTTSISFPCGIAIGATFDPGAAARLAGALADECLDREIHVLLGPTVNLHRHPLGGRHFEAFSEDPLLSAKLAVAYVRALQDRGVAATVKHLVANDTEFERHTISSGVEERVLRELYEVPFEAAVCDAGAWAVMSAYNKVNGTYAAEHEALLADTLRGDWGFDGIVVSDWFGAQSTVGSARAGLDLEMPGPPLYYGKPLELAVRQGELSEAVIDGHVRRLLVLAGRTGALVSSTGRQPRPSSSSIAARKAIARELASSSFVLLRNDPPMLPLELKAGGILAVIGPNASSTEAQGGGSAAVNPLDDRSVFQSLRDRLSPLGVTVVHELGCTAWHGTPVMGTEFALEYLAGTGIESDDLDPVARLTETAANGSFRWHALPGPSGAWPAGIPWVLRARSRLVPDKSGPWQFSLSRIGTARLCIDGATVIDARGAPEQGEGMRGVAPKEFLATIELEKGRSYEVTVDYAKRPDLPLARVSVGALPPHGTADELLERAEALAATADAVVCVVGTSASFETEGRDRSSMDLPGLQDHLVRRLLLANPRTCVLVNAGSPVTMDWADDVAALAQIWFPGEQGGEGVADVLLGDLDPGGRLPTTIPRRIKDTPAFPFYPGSDGHAAYGEGLLIGYRHYDTKDVAPRFCFGDGLSYTTFQLSELDTMLLGPLPAGRLSPGLEGPTLVRASLTVHNTGARAGTEVVQCYVRALDCRPGEPFQQLRAFEKLHLASGESRRVGLCLTARDFARYDEDARGWIASPGRYEIRVGRSSRDIALTALVELDRKRADNRSD
ncbi:MAG: beta-glucosidase [Acidimicrobiales bacterium]